MRSNGLKLNHKKVPPQHEVAFPYIEGSTGLEKLPRQVMEPPSGDIQTYLGVFQCHLFWVICSTLYLEVYKLYEFIVGHKGTEFIVSKPCVRWHKLNELKESCRFFFSRVAVKSRIGNERQEDRQTFHTVWCVLSLSTNKNGVMVIVRSGMLGQASVL